MFLFLAIVSFTFCYSQKTQDIDKAPEFPGGYRKYMTLLNQLTVYTIGHYSFEDENQSMKRFLKGSLMLQIDRCGNVVDTKCKSGIFSSYTMDAVKKINKIEKWKPAESQGEPIECTYTLEYEISPEKQRFILLEFKDPKPMHKEKRYFAYGEPNPILCGSGMVFTQEQPPAPPPKIVLPSFPGGLENLYDFIYPKINRDAITPPCEGIKKITVDILFTIDFTGQISGEDILFEGDTFAAEEVKKAVLQLNNYKKWKPATRNGKPFDTLYRLPLEFDLK